MVSKGVGADKGKGLKNCGYPLEKSWLHARFLSYRSADKTSVSLFLPLFFIIFEIHTWSRIVKFYLDVFSGVPTLR